MNITATRFATKTRTWLLIAGLTGLLIAIGCLLGGGALYIFVALAVLMNVVGYWFSDKLALKASRAKPVEPGTLPQLEGMVQDLAQRAQVPVPRLFLIPSEQPNAFATGRNPKHAAVAVTQGLLQHLPPEQVKGVLAHEFAHIKNRDILVSSIAAMVAGAISAIANVLQFSLLFGGGDGGHAHSRASRRGADPARGVASARVPRRRNRRTATRPRRAAGEGAGDP